MRFSLATMSCAIALALLGGCSASQNAATVPSSGAGAQNGAVIHGKMTPLALLQMQAAGKLPGPVTRHALVRDLICSEARVHQHIKTDSKGAIGIWASNTCYNALLGVSASGNKTITAINVADNGGYDPIAVKVDKYQNAWVANEYNDTYGGNVQEYNSQGSFVDGYNYYPFCGTGSVGDCYGYGFDSAQTTNSVYASEAYFYYEDSGTSSDTTTSDEGSGIFKFKLGDPSYPPSFISVSDYNDGTNCYDGYCDEVYYMDTDTSGNIWFDYYGYNGDVYGGGIGEVDTHGDVYIIMPPSTLGFPGGVVVSGKGHNQVLTVIDQDSRTGYEYRLPITASSTPFALIGPTRTNAYGNGDPVSGGYNLNSTKMALGDSYGWLDTCKVRTGKCKIASSANYSPGLEGAAYTPSNK